MATRSTRAPYVGPRRKLILALDIGTTYSGISYSILDPGQVPEIKCIERFPAHEEVSGASKIPTVIYYDQAGNVCAAGAETMREGIFEQAEEEGWIKAEWFKLHIRPKSGSSDHLKQSIPPLPPGKTIIRVLADFLQYLHKCTELYIKDAHGRDLWESLASEIDYVISHPNGWESYQQSQIRDAVVLAGLIPNTPDGHSRVSLVTEGQAVLYFSIYNGLPAGAMQAGDAVVIVNAGEGTIDICAFSKMMPDTDTKTGTFEEIAEPQCYFQGSVFVSIHARLFLENFLRDSKYYDDLDHIVRCFDETTKIRFSSDKMVQYIKFGSTRDNDPTCDIRFGQLKLTGAIVATFFEPSVMCIVNSVLAQIKDGHHPIKHVVVAGSFSASEWLFSKIDEALSPKGPKVIRAGGRVNWAVSDGALSFYLDHFAGTRVPQVADGSSYRAPCDPTNPEHVSGLTSREPHSHLPSGHFANHEEVPESGKANWKREIARIKETMDLEIKAAQDELDVKRKEVSRLTNALEEAQTELKTAKDDLQRSKEEVLSLTEDKKKLSDELSRLKDSLAPSRRHSRSITRRSGDSQVHLGEPSASQVRNLLIQPQTACEPGAGINNPPQEGEDKVSVAEAVDIIQKLNRHIVETASSLLKNLTSMASGDPACAPATLSSIASGNSTHNQEAVWLLGGDTLTSMLDFVSSTSGPTKGNDSCLKMLLQIALATWSAHHVHSWELGLNGSSAGGLSSDIPSPLPAIYEKLKIAEEPAVVTNWRSVTRSQIKFPPSAWTRALVSSLLGVFTFLRLTYHQPITGLAEDLQPLLSIIRSVREGLGESVVSKELEIVTATPGARFNSKCMRDILPGSGGFSKREIVVATCGLGLKEVSLEEPGSETLLVFPQVLRERSFSNLLESDS